MQTNNNQTGAKGAIAGFLAGALTTLAVGGYVLYGPGGKERRRGIESWVKKAKAEILEKVDAAEELTEKEYGRIVDQVMKKYAAMKEVGAKKAEIVAEKLKRGWEAVRERTEEAAADAKDALDEEDET